MEMSSVLKSPRPTRATASRLFMCPPDHFEVTYQINPWMTPDHWARNRDALAAQARAEWRQLKETYERLGHEVVTMAPAKGLPDMVFTANSGIVLNGRVLLAHFRHPERRGEEPHFARFFASLVKKGLLEEIIAPDPGIVFEGAGDAVWDPYRRFYWVGHSQRSDRAAVDMVARVFACPAVALHMVRDKYYHLDVALAPLSRGHLIYIPGAFNDHGLEVLKTRAGGAEWLVEAGEEDAAGFAVNAVNLGDDIVTAHCSDALRARLEALGYRVHVCPLKTFRMAGGGAFCLTLKLDTRA
ncbi:MAG: dimethylarginine dimethylaminohydrolase family protein [Pseudomonadota bacterium]